MLSSAEAHSLAWSSWPVSVAGPDPRSPVAGSTNNLPRLSVVRQAACWAACRDEVLRLSDCRRGGPGAAHKKEPRRALGCLFIFFCGRVLRERSEEFSGLAGFA